MLSDVEGPDFEISNVRFVLSYFSSVHFNLLLTFLTLRLGLDIGAGSTDSKAPFSNGFSGFLWGKKAP